MSESTVENPVGEIFRQYYDEYCRTHEVSKVQATVARHIMICRTAQLGGRLRICTTCEYLDFQYYSCKDRHCPQCGHYEKERWLLEQQKWVLPIPYYHAVFTISHALNPLVRWNRRQVYGLLMNTVGELLKEYGRRYLGGEIGVTTVLHTWGQTMQYHVHVHCIITGGALLKEAEGRQRWQSAKRNFLFPVKALSAEFRKRFCRALRRRWEAGKLVEPEGTADVAGMFAKAEGQDWEVYIERPMCGVQKLLDYLGRYIFRIAIGNYRIVKVKNGQVTFTYQDNRDGGTEKQMTISAVEFIRRFLQHVLPQGFVRIRHFGLHHSSCRAKLQKARQLLGLPASLPEIPKLNLADWLKSVRGEEADPDRCPKCGEGRMVTFWEFDATSLWCLLLGWLLAKVIWRYAPAY